VNIHASANLLEIKETMLQFFIGLSILSLTVSLAVWRTQDAAPTREGAKKVVIRQHHRASRTHAFKASARDETF
jgi:hypothetical protein